MQETNLSAEPAGRLLAECFYDFGMWFEFIWPLFLLEKWSGPLRSFPARLSFIFMQFQLNSHVGAPQHQRTLPQTATEQLCRTSRTKIKRVRWPQCISGSVNVKFKFRFNEHGATAVFVRCYEKLTKYCVIPTALVFFEQSHFIHRNRFSVFFCAFIHIRHWKIYRIENRIMKHCSPLMFHQLFTGGQYRPLTTVWTFSGLNDICKKPHIQLCSLDAHAQMREG